MKLITSHLSGRYSVCLIGIAGIVSGDGNGCFHISLSEEPETSSRSSRHASKAAQLAWIELKK